MKSWIVLASLSCLPLCAQADALDAYAGTWVLDGGSAHLTLSDCGDGTPCGEISWLNPEGDGDPTDSQNPDPDMRGRSLLGVQMLWGFTEKKGRWIKGRIYNPQDGRTYGSKIELEDPDTLKVKGCVGPICKTQLWPRAG